MTIYSREKDDIMLPGTWWRACLLSYPYKVPTWTKQFNWTRWGSACSKSESQGTVKVSIKHFLTIPLNFRFVWLKLADPILVRKYLQELEDLLCTDLMLAKKWTKSHWSRILSFCKSGLHYNFLSNLRTDRQTETGDLFLCSVGVMKGQENVKVESRSTLINKS